MSPIPQPNPSNIPHCDIMSQYRRIRRAPSEGSDQEGEDPKTQDFHIKKSLEGFSIPRVEQKSLTDSINEKLIQMASRSEGPESGKSRSSAKERPSLACGRKRSCEEISSSRSWVRDYDRALPETLLAQCSEDICNICQVDLNGSVQCRQHYEGAKHEKKVRILLSKIFTDEADTPKKRKLEVSSNAKTEAEIFLRKIESSVERDPSRMTYGEMKLDSWQEEWLLEWDCPLPPPIISLCRLTKCDLCSVTFTSVIMARSHFQGRNHDKKLRGALELYCSQQGLQLPRKHSDSLQEFERFCRICQVELTSDSMARLHFSGKKHAEKQNKLISGRATTSSVSDPTGRFGIGASFVSDIKVRDSKGDEDEVIRQSLEQASPEDGMDGTWGGTEVEAEVEAEVEDKPVPLMSLQFPPTHPFDNKSKNFSCPLCNVRLESQAAYDQHVVGKTHRKKQQAGGQTEREMRCEVCEVSLTSRIVYEDHIRGKQHQKKIGGVEEGQGEFSCEVCLVQCCSQDQLSSHLSGKSHQKRLASKAQGSGGFKCSVCNISTTDQHGLTQHLNGKAHQAKLKRSGYV